jgi:transposase
MHVGDQLIPLGCRPHPAYVARRTAEGLSTKEIIRCLKRYVARELYKILTCSRTSNQDLSAAA